ncbi:hypothetical protein TNIN_71651 [Trichonephila inaurata madagascariensis]|uniref:Uncharacterized protein n=1 Tax=Trichonephila inaurata madagascariensis TaxID=2747483 RepID=A0A8X6YMW9_9ARAC|nr:hypothetical protein TNIN_71651 [Trichonephila inaurata madagascariensis]
MDLKTSNTYGKEQRRLSEVLEIESNNDVDGVLGFPPSRSRKGFQSKEFLSSIKTGDGQEKLIQKTKGDRVTQKPFLTIDYSNMLPDAVSTSSRSMLITVCLSEDSRRQF